MLSFWPEKSSPDCKKCGKPISLYVLWGEDKCVIFEHNYYHIKCLKKIRKDNEEKRYQFNS